jgi:hypothetical protein
VRQNNFGYYQDRKLFIDTQFGTGIRQIARFSCSILLFVILAFCQDSTANAESRDTRSTPIILQSLKERAEKGEAKAQFQLAYGYHLLASSDRGKMKEAVFWYQKAAKNRHPGAQYNLGVMYATGKTLPRDDAKFEKWMGASAAQGFAAAQASLGIEYSMTRNLRTGIKWLRKAAQQGGTGASLTQAYLSDQYLKLYVEEGKLNPEYLEEAHYWRLIAAKRTSFTDIKELTPAQNASLRKRLAEWKTKSSPVTNNVEQEKNEIMRLLESAGEWPKSH